MKKQTAERIWMMNLLRNISARTGESIDTVADRLGCTMKRTTWVEEPDR